MAIVSSIKRVNESEISRAPRADRDIYVPATDANGNGIGYGRQLIARKGQPIPARYRNHPAVTKAVIDPKPLEIPAAAVQIPSRDQLPAVTTMVKKDLIDELADRGVEIERGTSVTDLRDILRSAREEDHNGGE